jgi:hypothetical protein
MKEFEILLCLQQGYTVLVVKGTGSIFPQLKDKTPN